MTENTKIAKHEKQPEKIPLETMDEEEQRQFFSALTQKQLRTLTAQLTDYIKSVGSWKRLFWINMVAGISRGLGFALGTTLIIALLIKLLHNILALNIPYLTDWIAEIIHMAQAPLF